MIRRALLPTLAAGFLTSLFTACGGFETLSSEDGSVGTHATGSGGSFGAGGDAGIDEEFGGSQGEGRFDYAELCGQGCEVGQRCAPEPAGEGGGGGTGMGGHRGGSDASYICRVTLAEGAEEVASTCELAGSSLNNEPCLDSSDCGAGLGCVSGVCRTYCCGDLEACPTGTYCEPRPMAQGDLPPGTSSAPFIPICTLVDDCKLLDDSTCPDGKTCTIVRADGTTSCVMPGPGAAGEPCPCAAGHVCAPNINQCFEICRLDREGDCPSGYTCQGGGTGYPDDFGICIQN